MGEPLYAKMRGNKRFNVELNATYVIKGQATQSQACRVADLSSKGAKVRFPSSETLQSGTVVVMDIAIPDTIMRVTTEAEIMWTRQRFNQLISGLRFKHMLSDSMVQQIVKKTTASKKTGADT